MFRLAITAAALAAGFATTGSTAQGGDGLEKALAGLTPGEARKCIVPQRVNFTRGYDGTILYVEGRNRLWRNDTVGEGCRRGINRDDLIVARSVSGDYCRGDIVETRSRAGGALTGTCTLGEFVPYTKQSAAK